MGRNLEKQVQAVIAKAGADPAFRKPCLSNPNAAIKQATGIEVAAGTIVRFVDGREAHLTFVLPGTVSASNEMEDEGHKDAAGM